MKEETQIGALISEQHVQKAISYMLIGKSEGVNLVAWCERQFPDGCDGRFFNKS